MRILLTTDTVGGVWTFTRELVGELLKAGHHVWMVSFGRKQSEEQSGWCCKMERLHGRRFGCQASNLPLEWMPNNERVYEAGKDLLLNTAEEFRPDLIHSNQFCFGALPVSIPKVITAHSDVLSWADVCRPQGLEATPWLIRYINYLGEGLAGADLIVAPTSWMLGAIGQHFALPRQCRIILNGRSVANEQGPLPRRMQAVSVGRLWDDAKNVSMLREVRAKLPILIAGEESFQDVVRDCKSLSRRDDGLSYLGACSEDEVIKFFRSSSVYIASSIYEPFGLAPLEAALCGCAVVANDIPSLREVWGGAALYFNGVSALQQLLDNLCKDEVFLQEAQRRSKLRADQLTSSKMAYEYESVYSQLTSSEKGFPVEVTGTRDRHDGAISYAS